MKFEDAQKQLIENSVFAESADGKREVRVVEYQIALNLLESVCGKPKTGLITFGGLKNENDV